MLRLAQIGMGGWGQNWAEEVIPTVPGVQLKTVIDADKKALAQTRKRLGEPEDVVFLPSLEQAIREVDFDALLITCGPATHVPLAVQALKAGKHVLTEKPFGLSTQEARRALRAAAKAKRTLMVSQNYRFYPAVQAARRLLEQEKYGVAGSAAIQFRRQAPRDQRGRPITKGAYPFLLDMVIHHVDLIRYIFDADPTAVFCRAWNPPWSQNDHPQALAALFTMNNAMTISYDGSWVTTGIRTPWGGTWRIECTDAELNLTTRGSGMAKLNRATRRSGTDDDRITVVRPARKPIDVRLRTLKHFDRAGSLNEFTRAIRDNRQPACAGQDNIKSLAVVEAMSRSIKSTRQEAVRTVSM